MKASEKYLVAGLLFILAFGGIGLYGVFPAFEGVREKLDTISQKEAQITAFKTTISALNTQIVKYQKLEELPEGLVVREFKPDSYEKNIKMMIDKALAMATQTGNDLISLKPWSAPMPAISSEPVSLEEGETADENGDLKPKPKDDVLRTYGYEMVIRGAYDNVNGFLSAMNGHNELMEINSIKLENETGQDREESAGNSLSNPLKPIKMTAKIALFLQNKQF